MKKVMQFRFEGFQNPNNYPNFSDYNAVLGSGNLFNDYKLISQFGMQAPPGLRFYLNGGSYPITMGETGIYELDLNEVGRINSIRFEAEDISKFFPNDNILNRLLIDIVYEGGINS